MSNNNDLSVVAEAKTNDQDETAGFSQRLLMSLVVDISTLHETVEQVMVKVFTMAKENGVPVPPVERA